MSHELAPLFAAGFVYLLALFLIAYATDRNYLPSHWAAHPLTYTLSIGVYATSWTYYGSVGYIQRSLTWSPSLSYRFASFSGDDPDTTDKDEVDAEAAAKRAEAIRLKLLTEQREKLLSRWVWELRKRSEVKVLVINLGAEPHTIRHGDRIAQMVVAPVSQARAEEADALPATGRGEGGFGHTGSA